MNFIGTQRGGFLKELDINNEIEAILVILEFLELSRFVMCHCIHHWRVWNITPFFWGPKI